MCDFFEKEEMGRRKGDMSQGCSSKACGEGSGAEREAPGCHSPPPTPPHPTPPPKPHPWRLSEIGFSGGCISSGK